MAGVLARLTTKYVEAPLRYRAAAKPTRVVPLRVRLRRPTIVLGSVVALLGVTLTATSFTWREHVTIQRANGKEQPHPHTSEDHTSELQSHFNLVSRLLLAQK